MENGSSHLSQSSSPNENDDVPHSNYLFYGETL